MFNLKPIIADISTNLNSPTKLGIRINCLFDLIHMIQFPIIIFRRVEKLIMSQGLFRTFLNNAVSVEFGIPYAFIQA